MTWLLGALQAGEKRPIRSSLTSHFAVAISTSRISALHQVMQKTADFRQFLSERLFGNG